MSHVALNKSNVIIDIKALKIAVEKLGLELVKQKNYRWYNRSVGDYPLPEGWTAADIGANATYVIRFPKAKELELTAKNYSQAPYEIGVVEDKRSPGQFHLAYDHFLGGYGIDDVVGAPVYEQDDNIAKLTTLCPKLLQQYSMACDQLAAQEAGDSITFMTTREAHVKHPEHFQQIGDDETYVSFVDTSNRVSDAALAFDQVRA